MLFLCVLMVNLCWTPWYRAAFAQPAAVISAAVVNSGVIGTAQPCNDDDLEGDPQDYTALFAEQEAIWNLLFAGDFAWCTGSGWLMDTEIAGAPNDPFEVTTYSGVTLDGQPFLFDVGLFFPFTDWENAEGITQTELDFVADTNYTFAIVGGIVHGPSQESVELWGIAQSMDDGAGELAHTFIPMSRGDVLPEPVILPQHIQPGTPLYNCLEDAKEDYDYCLQEAKEDLGFCLGLTLSADIYPFLSCLVTAPFPPAASLIVPCGLALAIALVIELAFCIGKYIDDKQDFLDEYHKAMNRCFDRYPYPSDPSDP